MQPFQFTRVDTTQGAFAGAVTGEGKFIAGGTNLLDLMKFGIETPKQVIDINPLGLQSIDITETGDVRIGALVSNTDLAYHPLLQKRFPVLSQAILSGASPQLRNMATVGGNLMQRTRCPYFYDVQFPCNKRVPLSGCSALTGYNRMNAVLGGSDSCIATHPSDMCVALAALGAIIQVSSVAGTREIQFNDFHLLPGSTPELETVLKAGELITAVLIPNLPFARQSLYLKVRDRASYEFALASAAVALEVVAGRIQNARVALGGVGTKPWRSVEAESVLVGAEPGQAIFRDAADAALRGAKAQKYNAFKIDLAKNTLVRALMTVGGAS